MDSKAGSVLMILRNSFNVAALMGVGGILCCLGVIPHSGTMEAFAALVVVVVLIPPHLKMP